MKMRYIVAVIGITCSSAVFSQQASATNDNVNAGRFLAELFLGVSDKNLTDLGTRLQEKSSRGKGAILYHPQKKNGSLVLLNEDDIANMALNGVLQLGLDVCKGSSAVQTASNVTQAASTIYITRKIDQVGALAAEKVGLTNALQQYPVTYALITAAGRTMSSVVAQSITVHIAKTCIKQAQ